MKILAHRGLWKTIEEKNTEIAFERAFKAGYGIETDIRDYKGELVISHNIADANSMPLAKLIELYKKYDNSVILALNVKADGLQKKIKKCLDDNNIKSYFLFDMSIPEQVVYVNENFNVFTRESELERNLVLYDKCNGVWMDSFKEDWIRKEKVECHLNNKKSVGIISPEIHNQKYLKLWERLKNIKSEKLMLCTDIPMRAEEYFNE